MTNQRANGALSISVFVRLLEGIATTHTFGGVSNCAKVKVAFSSPNHVLTIEEISHADSASPPPVIGISANFRRWKTVLFGFLSAVTVVLCGIHTAEGQTLKADYRFQNTRGSAVGNSSLADTGANMFQSDIVDSITRTVLRFPFNNGLRLSPTTGIIPSNSYTIVMLFKVDSVSNFVRLVDFNNRTSDNGLYIASGHLENCTTCTSLAANTYVQVVYTRNSSGTFSGYLNGVLQGQGPDGGAFVIDGSNVLNFFQDDLVFGGEASAGSVARIRCTMRQ